MRQPDTQVPGPPARSGGSLVVPAAALDGQARLVLVAWHCAWFALVAGLMAWSFAGGGAVALAAAMVAGVVVPALVLGRVAGLPAAYEIDGDRLVVRRYLLRDRVFRVRGPATGDPRTVARLRRRAVLLGGGYGCRTVTLEPAGVGGPEPVRIATTNLRRVLRVPTTCGPLLVSPADPEAVRAAVAGQQP